MTEGGKKSRGYFTPENREQWEQIFDQLTKIEPIIPEGETRQDFDTLVDRLRVLRDEFLRHFSPWVKVGEGPLIGSLLPESGLSKRGTMYVRFGTKMVKGKRVKVLKEEKLEVDE